jgi:hypothetical protein
VPKGKRLYWIGPSAEGFALRRVSPYPSVEQGASVHYAGSRQFEGGLDVITYTSDHRAGGMNDPATSSRVVARMITPSHQLVILATSPLVDAVPPARLLARLRADLVAVTPADIRALPDDWGEISHSG